MNIDFVGKRKLFYGLSLLLTVVSLVSFFVKGFEQDIEFKGGTIIEINLGKTFENSEIEAIVAQIAGVTPKVQKMTDGVTGLETKVSISTTSLEEAQKNQIINEIHAKYGIEKTNQDTTFRTVKPTFGDEMKSRVWKATILASIGIALYIALVFHSMSGWKAGVSAIMTLIHDLLLMLGFYSVLGIPLNTTFVAAMLTVLGYSINDTVVIYDRIRENGLTNRKMKDEEIVNLSINQSMRRTLFTAISVIVALILMYGFAIYYKVTSIQEFALPLVIGLLSGTYSSICLAGNFWISWNKILVKGKK